jgi:hypothetical protein
MRANPHTFTSRTDYPPLGWFSSDGSSAAANECATLQAAMATEEMRGAGGAECREVFAEKVVQLGFQMAEETVPCDSEDLMQIIAELGSGEVRTVRLGVSQKALGISMLQRSASERMLAAEVPGGGGKKKLGRRLGF